MAVQEQVMTITPTSHFLRRALLVDAAITGAAAVLLVAGAPILQDLLGLRPALLRGAGLSLIPFTALLWYLLRADPLPRGAVWLVVACNAIWALDSIALLFTGWVDPTGIGQAFVVFQALIVAGFAEMQYLGLRRSRAN
jgi:hypothetical protein